MVDKKRKQPSSTEEVIAAFDRERDEAHEHSRRHTERIRNSRESDRPYSDRKSNQ
jgi:hypothetical protein